MDEYQKFGKLMKKKYGFWEAHVQRHTKEHVTISFWGHTYAPEKEQNEFIKEIRRNANRYFGADKIKDVYHTEPQFRSYGTLKIKVKKNV